MPDSSQAVSGWALSLHLFSLPHRPCSTTFFTHLGFCLSFEVSLLHFQSGHWSFPPILICIYSLPCSLPPFTRRVFLPAALKKLAKHFTAPLASSQGTVEGVGPGYSLRAFSPLCGSPTLTEQALQTTETLSQQDLVPERPECCLPCQWLSEGEGHCCWALSFFPQTLAWLHDPRNKHRRNKTHGPDPC